MIIKKVFKIHYSNYTIIECEVIKETDKTITYLQDQHWPRKERKANLNQKMELIDMVCTSKTKLISLAKEQIEDNIKRLNAQIRVEQEKFNKLKTYKNGSTKEIPIE